MKQICSILLFFLISAGSYAQNFADYFQNKTLRVDYIFTGNNKQQAPAGLRGICRHLSILA